MKAERKKPIRRSKKTAIDVDVPAFRRAVLEKVAEKLLTSNGEMFKDSQRCKPPHCNIDLLRDDLFQSRYISELQPKDPLTGKDGLADEIQRQVTIYLC